MARARASNRALAGLTLLALLWGASGCSTSGFEKRFDEADRLRQQAAARGYEWVGTADLLEQARATASEGDTDTALELVEQARFQAEAALQQADYESEAWRRRVVGQRE